MKPLLTAALTLLLTLAAAPAQQLNPDVAAHLTTLDIAPVWAGHPVGFALLTAGDQQYAAFYDRDRHMTVAQRTLGHRSWTLTILPSTLGWDSHNSIALAIDRAGYLHLAGNMHSSPLVYFRATRPNDAASLQRVPAMTAAPEDHVTYPVFSHAPDGALLFQYRYGRSGQGDTFTNRYDESTRTWTPLTTQPLFSGEAHRNAYPIPAVLGPDGWYHQVWVWRDTPMAETNHDLSYARSRDLIHWQTAAGRPLTLPLTLETTGLIVDPVPARGGIINNLQSIGFDAQHRPILAYTRYDAAGNSQLMLARLEQTATGPPLWHIAQATDWHYRWDFHGGGTLNFEIHLGPVTPHPDGTLTIAIQHKIYGSATWRIDPTTLHLTKSLGAPSSPTVLSSAKVGEQASSRTTQLEPQSTTDSAPPRPDGIHYTLHWQTLPENRDQPRPGPLPPPSMLRLERSQ
jgi:hypothetical protein